MNEGKATTAQISMAKRNNVEIASNIVREARQIHGGMGFTWEFDCHLYYRGSLHLALVLGSQRRWKDRLVSLLETRNFIGRG